VFRHYGSDAQLEPANCAAALNNVSAAAELGSVELTFTNVVASTAHESRLSTDFSFDPK